MAKGKDLKNFKDLFCGALMLERYGKVEIFNISDDDVRTAFALKSQMFNRAVTF